MIYITGILMALADSVPGVSGGTIAFILNQYDNFIGAISGLLKSDKRRSSIEYLLKWGIGWIGGFLVAIIAISSLLESHIYEISSMFLAFILFAIITIIYNEKENMKQYFNIIFSVLGIVSVIMITKIGFQLNITDSQSVMEVTGFSYFYFYVCGVVAVSAMLLPGMSGSTTLLIFGVYYFIIDAIKEILILNFTYLPLLFVFGLGIMSGVFIATAVISRLLKNYYGAMLYLIIGLMIGSLYSIIYGPTTLMNNSGVPNEPLSLSSFSVLFFIIGGIVILGVNFIKVKERN